jgi:hypothetical protein
MVFRSVNERILELGQKLDGGGLQEVEFACECTDDSCVERTSLTARQFGEIEENENQFIVLPGHERPGVEDVVAEHEGFLIVSKRGAGAEWIKEVSS